MHILKFGGTSLGNAERILQCRNIAIDRCRKIPTLVVVSAISEVTNILADSIQAVQNGGDPKKYIRLFYERHLSIIEDLFSKNSSLQKNLITICDQYLAMQQEIQFMNHCSDSLSARILSLGEVFSAKIFFKLLKKHLDFAKLLNSTNYIKTKHSFLEGIPLLDEIKKNFLKVKNNPPPIMVMSGFIASNMKNEITLLGRNSSDYSAALAAYALGAKRCEIWTDVDGIYTADPRIKSDVRLIPHMSYQEAVELANCGATVLHPKAIKPLEQSRIPLWIKNSLNIQAKGTKISYEPIYSQLRKKVIYIFLLGPGAVGKQLLEQIQQRKNILLQDGIDIKACYIANSKFSLFEKDGIDLSSWKLKLERSKQKMQIKDVLDYVNHEQLMNSVLVDCTSSGTIAENYLYFFKSRMHVIAANKKANSGIAAYYKALREFANRYQRRFLYETNVGAGLPIIDTLQNLLKSGDELLQFSGILSGSLSYIFGLLEENIPFSQAIHMAHQNNFTEPDPRDDLSGLDVARKLLILYREAGGCAELHDVSIQSIFPNDFDSSGTVNEFLNKAKHLDDYFQKRMVSLKIQGKVLRLIGEINHVGQCCVRLAEIGSEHPMFSIKDGENAFAFYTKRYSPIPLVVKGYGAGPAVTAAGIFADILRTVHTNGVSHEN